MAYLNDDPDVAFLAEIDTRSPVAVETVSPSREEFLLNSPAFSMNDDRPPSPWTAPILPAHSFSPVPPDPALLHLASLPKLMELQLQPNDENNKGKTWKEYWSQSIKKRLIDISKNRHPKLLKSSCRPAKLKRRFDVSKFCRECNYESPVKITHHSHCSKAGFRNFKIDLRPQHGRDRRFRRNRM